MPPPGCRIALESRLLEEIGRYGLGNARSLKQFEQFSGIEVRKDEGGGSAISVFVLV